MKEKLLELLVEKIISSESDVKNTHVSQTYGYGVIGKFCIIRSYDAGVFFGTVEHFDDVKRIVKLTEARRVHYWVGAASLSQMAVDGLSQDGSRISVVVPEQVILNVIEVITCSAKAALNLREYKIWSK